jgi:hypothetical protein
MIFSKVNGIAKMPKLHTPTLTVSGKNITINNPTENGELAERWVLFEQDTKNVINVIDISQSTIQVESGTYYARLEAHNWVASDISNVVTVS